MKSEAKKLKKRTWTKVVTVGIGNDVSQDELNNIATSPADTNVILVANFSSLLDAEDHIRNTTCSGQFSSLIS